MSVPKSCHREVRGGKVSLGEMRRPSCDNENGMNIHNVTFQFLPCCWSSSGGSCQHSRWQTLKGCGASGKLLSFVGPVHVCGCVRGEVGKISIYLIIFKRERETNGSLRLKKLLAYKEAVSCFRGMRHVCLLFEFSVWFHLTFLISQNCEFFLNKSAIKKKNRILIRALAVA